MAGCPLASQYRVAGCLLSADAPANRRLTETTITMGFHGNVAPTAWEAGGAGTGSGTGRHDPGCPAGARGPLPKGIDYSEEAKPVTPPNKLATP